MRDRSTQLKEIKMKKHRRLLLLFIMIIGLNSAKSQNLIIGGTGNIGLSKVTSNLPISGDYKTKFTLSGNLGMFLEKKIGQKSSLGIEAIWVQIEGKEITDDIELTGINGQDIEVIGVISDRSTLHSSYVGIPVYYRIEFGKIGIKGGFQSMIFLFASSNYEANGEINGEPYEADSEMKDIEFDRIDIGPKVGVDYRLNGKFRLRVDYYHGLTDITSDEYPWERRNRQFNLGVSYIFGNNE